MVGDYYHASDDSKVKPHVGLDVLINKAEELFKRFFISENYNKHEPIRKDRKGPAEGLDG